MATLPDFLLKKKTNLDSFPAAKAIQLAQWLSTATANQVDEFLYSDHGEEFFQSHSPDEPFIRFFKRGLAHIFCLSSAWALPLYLMELDDVWPDVALAESSKSIQAFIQAFHPATIPIGIQKTKGAFPTVPVFDVEAALDPHYRCHLWPSDDLIVGRETCALRYKRLTAVANQYLLPLAKLQCFNDILRVPNAAEDDDLTARSPSIHLVKEVPNPGICSSLFGDDTLLFFEMPSHPFKSLGVKLPEERVFEITAPTVLHDARQCMLLADSPITCSYIPMSNKLIIWSCVSPVSVSVRFPPSTWTEVCQPDADDPNVRRYRVSLVTGEYSTPMIDFTFLPLPFVRMRLLSTEGIKSLRPKQYYGIKNLKVEGDFELVPRYNAKLVGPPLFEPGNSTYVWFDLSNKDRDFVDVEVTHSSSA